MLECGGDDAAACAEGHRDRHLREAGWRGSLKAGSDLEGERGRGGEPSGEGATSDGRGE